MWLVVAPPCPVAQPDDTTERRIIDDWWRRAAEGALSRRNVLLAGTTFAAASVAASVNPVYVAQAQQPIAASERKPNIVFILVDNVGWGDFGVYGGTTPTPRIDKFASEGIRFNSYYVEAQCTPSRSAIMTGRQSVRSGTYTVRVPGTGAYGLAPWEYTLPESPSGAGSVRECSSTLRLPTKPWTGERQVRPASAQATRRSMTADAKDTTAQPASGPHGNSRRSQGPSVSPSGGGSHTPDELNWRGDAGERPLSAMLLHKARL
jgi:hypothetical protein